MFSNLYLDLQNIMKSFPNLWIIVFYKFRSYTFLMSSYSFFLTFFNDITISKDEFLLWILLRIKEIIIIITCVLNKIDKSYRWEDKKI